MLVVDDDPMLQKLLRRVLERAGYDVVTAGSSEDALRWVAQGSTGVDLLISDLLLPGLGGDQLLTLFQRHCPRAKVLLMSGLLDGCDRVATRGWPTLAKPFHPDALLRVVAELLRQGGDSDADRAASLAR